MAGNVRLTLTERKKVRGVYICLSGDAHTKWSEYVEELRGIGDDRKPVRVLKHYHGHENVLNAKIFVVGGNNGEKKKLRKNKLINEFDLFNLYF